MKLTHAGGVVFSNDRDRNLFLVISSSNGKDWVFPKGHIEPGETPQKTVLRELQEETGIVGEIIAELPKQFFNVKNETVYVQYFLIKLNRYGKANENRILKWVGEETAFKLLSFENSRNVLKDAIKVINVL